MKIKFINEGVFGSYKNRISKSDRLAQTKRETATIVKDAIAKEFREKFVSAFKSLYNSDTNFRHAYSGFWNALEYDFLRTWFDLWGARKNGAVSVDIRIIDGKACYVVYVEPMSSNMHHWIYDEIWIEIFDLEQNLRNMLLDNKKIQDVYKECDVPLNLDLMFEFYPNNSIIEEKEDFQNGDHNKNTIEEFLDKKFTNKREVYKYYNILDCYGHPSKYINESVFGNYKDKSSQEGKLNNLKKETQNILRKDFTNKVKEIIDSYVKEYDVEISNNIDDLNHKLYYLSWLEIINKYKDYFNVVIDPDYNITLCIDVKPISEQNEARLTKALNEYVKNLLKLLRSLFANLSSRLAILYKKYDLIFDWRKFNFKLNYASDIPLFYRIDKRSYNKETYIKIYEDFLGFFINKKEVASKLKNLDFTLTPVSESVFGTYKNKLSQEKKLDNVKKYDYQLYK